MPDRLELLLKLTCAGLAMVLLIQLVRLLQAPSPLAGVTVPRLPSAPPPVEGTNSPPPRPGPPKPFKAPPAVQTRIDQIKQSEVFGPVPKPLPMALLGIAGQDVFLRSPSGRTTLIREGDELDGVKLLRVAPNRILVEHEGVKKELTIFSGLGSESLLPKEKEKPQ